MDVQLQESNPPSFPAKCACCLKPTRETPQSYRHTVRIGLLEPKGKTTKLDIPHCRPCRDHVDWSVGGGLLGVILAVPVYALLVGMSAALIVFVWQMASMWAYEHEALTNGMGIGAVVVVVALLTWRRASKRPANGAIGRGHTRAGESVQIAGYTGRGVVTIRIHNPEFAHELASLNPKLLRDVANR